MCYSFIYYNRVSCFRVLYNCFPDPKLLYYVPMYAYLPAEAAYNRRTKFSGIRHTFSLLKNRIPQTLPLCILPVLTNRKEILLRVLRSPSTHCRNTHSPYKSYGLLLFKTFICQDSFKVSAPNLLYRFGAAFINISSALRGFPECCPSAHRRTRQNLSAEALK